MEFVWKLFWWINAAKEQHIRNVYLNLIQASQIVTGEYNNIDSKLHILAENTEANIWNIGDSTDL